MDRVKIPPEADSLSIDGWDMDNGQQQAYIRAINRHLIKTVDTDNDNKAAKTADAEGDGDGEGKEEARENHGIIGCGIYYPWVTQTDQWAEALQKAEAATGYRASWHWNMERGEEVDVQNWETTRGDPKKKGKKIEPEKDRYTKKYEPYQKAYMARVQTILKARRWAPEEWEGLKAEREQRFEETLKRHQKMFAELLGNK